jgi:hypothetical protein
MSFCYSMPLFHRNLYLFHIFYLLLIIYCHGFAAGAFLTPANRATFTRRAGSALSGQQVIVAALGCFPAAFKEKAAFTWMFFCHSAYLLI